MLEGVGVVLHVVVVVVGVSKEAVARGKYIRCAEVGLWQEEGLWLAHLVHVLGVVRQIAA